MGDSITINGGPLEMSYTPAQEQVFCGSDKYRYVVWAKGRRCGGTRGAAQYVIEQMLDGKSVLWVDTIQGNLTRYYERYFLPVLTKLKRQYWSWHYQSHTLKILKAHMDMRSAEKPQNIEGFGYDLIICNEAGIIFNGKKSLWHNTLAPMLLDTKGRAFFVGTPKGKRDRKDATEHLFYTFFRKGAPAKLGGNVCTDKEWVGYQDSSYSNPLLSPDDIRELETEIPSIIREQEIGAKYIDVLADSIIKEAWWMPVDETPVEAHIIRKVISVDTAFKEHEEADYSAITIWYQTSDSWYMVDAWQDHVTYPDLIKEVKAKYAFWSPDIVLIEDKASGQSLIQSLQVTSMPVVPFKIDRDKVSRLAAVSPLFEAGKIKYVKGPNAQMVIDQVSMFPSVENDDLVDTVSQCLLYTRGSHVYNTGRDVIGHTVRRRQSERLRNF
jgi:predicted phage terminase large subunit-like protein